MKAARQQAIVDLLITHSSLTTETLSKQLNVSRETIRRDLSELQAQGKVLRNHGRAKVIHQRSQDSGDPFHMRLKSHYAHKADIAREALAWIDEGMVIALDASSTCWYLARQLPDRPLHVFTNSQPICQELGALWDSNAFNADFKSILLKRAAQSLLLIDKSKFNRSGEARIGHLDDVTHIVSDAPQP